MTPKEKAKELVDKMKATCLITDDYVYESTSKQCALIAVYEIIEANKKCSYTIDYVNYLDLKKIDAKIRSEIEIFMFYWQEVKNEINKL